MWHHNHNVEIIMLREFSLAGLLFSPMCLYLPLAAVLTWLTLLLLPIGFIHRCGLKRSHVGCALFVCLLSGVMAVSDGAWS